MYTHLKRKSPNPRRTDAFDKTLCGREDPGLYAYVTLKPGEPLPEESEVYPTCPKCVAAHLRGE